MKKTPSNVRIKNFKIDSEKIGKNKKSRKKTTLLILIIKHANLVTNPSESESIHYDSKT